MKLWPVPQDLDDDISLMLSAEHKPTFHYRYNIIKLTFRNRHNGQQGKAIQLLSIRDTETEKANDWLIKDNKKIY